MVGESEELNVIKKGDKKRKKAGNFLKIQNSVFKFSLSGVSTGKQTDMSLSLA